MASDTGLSLTETTYNTSMTRDEITNSDKTMAKTDIARCENAANRQDSLSNVKVMAAPLEGATVETEVKS